MFKDSRILITGGTGTLGHELSRQLIDFNCKEIIIYSRNEVAQVEMKRLFPGLNYLIGDVRDKSAIKEACKNVDIVFHLAAIKHVSICESQPMEAVKTNIIGTQNVIDACKGRLISMSTDKAVNPTSIYGYTKAINEVNVLNAGGINIRSGNIFGSSGSVIPFFISQVKTKNKLTLTNGSMTRYFIPVESLTKFILETTFKTSGIYCPSEMQAYRMSDIAAEIVSLYGDSKTEIIEIGQRPGEKLHESLDGIHFSNECLGNAKELCYK
jgi:FlaA1/EpsC-like NDP-sugar epimerase